MIQLVVILFVIIFYSLFKKRETFVNHDITNGLNLFWQYPVITEKTFYLQNKNDSSYLDIPWATIIDKKINHNKIKPYIDSNKTYTCAQHISFRTIIPLLREKNINTLYTPHKVINENSIKGVIIKPCPLYAVNYEDNKRNKLFRNKDFVSHRRKLLYSFIGGYQRDYLTDIRLRIFEMKHPNNTLIKNTGGWHFNKVVYNKKQSKKGELNENKTDDEKTTFYNQTLLDSRYSLCPSGTGPNSIRFWESLAIGSIPILLSDTLDLPKNKLWKISILRVKEDDVEKIPEILNNISWEEENKMRINCIKIYHQYRNNYKFIN